MTPAATPPLTDMAAVADAAHQRYVGDMEDALAAGRRPRAMKALLAAADRYPAGVFSEPDESVLVWSDLHLGHANIIRYANRPFRHLDEMNGALWANLMRALGPEKTLVVVGDVAMGPALNEGTWNRLRYLPCKASHLVVGNHDITGTGQLRARGFGHVWSLMVSNGEPPLIWTHKPLAVVPMGYVNVHGHQHDEAPARTPHINVSVEQLDYRPVALSALRALALELVKGVYPEGNTTLARLRAIGHMSSTQRRKRQ